MKLIESNRDLTTVDSPVALEGDQNIEFLRCHNAPCKLSLPLAIGAIPGGQSKAEVSPHCSGHQYSSDGEGLFTWCIAEPQILSVLSPSLGTSLRALS